MRAALAAVYRAVLPRRLRVRVRARWDARLVASVGFPASPAWPPPAEDPIVIADRAPEAWPPGSGVNMLGYMSGQFGLGVGARAYSRALLSAGYPVALIDARVEIPHALHDRSLSGHLRTDPVFGTTMIFVNPDFFEAALRSMAAREPRPRLAGCWFWELPRAPEAWRAAIESVDEIIVATDFVADAFRAVTAKPVTRIPFPIILAPRSALTREHLGVPAEAFLFLCTFDFNSSVDRKNPAAVIRAFRMAFPEGDERVFLLVKSSNAACNPDALRTLLALVEDDRRIAIRDGVVDASHLHAMQALSDCYVSLHRAEGLGLGMAESMRLGKPVIATAWSGNMQFMDADTAFLVDYELVPVRPGEYPHGEGQVWAEPDVAHAARQMRRVFGDPAHTASVAASGRHAVTRGMSLERSAQALISHLTRFPERALATASALSDRTMPS